MQEAAAANAAEVKQKGRTSMSNITVQKVQDPTAKPLPIFQEMENLCQKIRRRAFDYFQERGSQFGHALEDWLKAEREAFGWPAAEMKDQEKQYELQVTLPGFDAKEIQVTATPSEILIHAKAGEEKKTIEGNVVWSEFGQNDVYRRFEMPQPIDVDQVAAKLEKGILKVVAAKGAAPQKKTIAVAAAA